MNRLSDKLEEEDPVTQGLVDQLLYEKSFSNDYNEDHNDHYSSVNSDSHCRTRWSIRDRQKFSH